MAGDRRFAPKVEKVDMGADMRGVAKFNLPTKICATCGKPFTWRKKWEKVWDDVKYCSDKCRGLKRNT
jgi:hypothetical protein